MVSCYSARQRVVAATCGETKAENVKSAKEHMAANNIGFWNYLQIIHEEENTFYSRINTAGF